MTPIRGWGPKGKRLRACAPHGHRCTLTFLGALRNDRLTAPCVFDGPINGQCFRAYVEQQLVPILKPGDIAVMDNLGSHKARLSNRASKPPVRGCGSWRRTHPISIRSNRPFPGSSTGCASHKSEPSTRRGLISAGWSKQSNHTNVPIISPTLGMLPLEHELL